VVEDAKSQVVLYEVFCGASDLEAIFVPVCEFMSQLVKELSFKEAAVVKALPKTRSGKTLRSTMRKIVDGKDYVVPSTIDDPTVLDAIADAAKTIGYGKK